MRHRDRPGLHPAILTRGSSRPHRIPSAHFHAALAPAMLVDRVSPVGSSGVFMDDVDGLASIVMSG
jgi:hypothetical protein